MHAATRGIALLLDEEGTIREVLSDDEGLLAHAEAGTALADLVPTGQAATRAFVETISEQGAAFGWELSIAGRDGEHLARFSGTRSSEGLHVVGVLYHDDLHTYYRKLLEAHNEQVTRHRSTLKEESLRSREQLQNQVALFEDITRLNNELVAAQRELAQKNAALKRLDEQKNRFLGMATHDLRSPLSNIIMFSDVLRDKVADVLDADHLKLLEQMRRSTRHMLHLVEDFLDVASIESGRLQLRLREVDLNELVADNVAANRALAERKGITLEMHATEKLPPAVLDPDKIEQVLSNLISNAIKYSPQHARVDVHLDRDEDHVLLAVSDTGQGIPADEQDRLFKPFGRTSVRSTAGEKSTGLGLVIVKKIVEGHGGTVSVESATGEGSTFTVSLPLRQSEPAAEAE